MNLPPSAIRRRRRARPVARSAFGQIIAPYVSVAEIDDLDAKMRHLNTDVVSLSAGEAPSILMGEAWSAWWKRSREIGDFQWSWASFYTAWGQWRDDHYGEWSRTGDDVRQEFDNTIAGFNERLRDFKARFGAEATTVTTTTPAGKAAAKTLGDIADVLKLAIVAIVGFFVLREVRK